MTGATPLQQHPSFAAALARLGLPPLWLEAPHPLLMQSRRFPGGLHLNMLSRVTLPVPEALAEWLGPHRAPLIVAPDQPAPKLALTGAVPLMTPATVAEIALAGTEVMRARLHQKWRNRLLHAERLGLRVTDHPMKPDPSHWLFAAEAGQRRARGYRGWPEALTLAWLAANPRDSRLFTAWQGAEPVAAMLFLRHGEAATYHIGHTKEQGRASSGHSLLLWQAMNWHARNGCQTLDLGLIDTVTAPGLARFKLGSGAVPRRLGGTWGWWPRLGRTLAPLARLDRAAFAHEEQAPPASSLS